MTAIDVEPWLIDAIKLLYSKNEDSEMLLKQMLDEQIAVFHRREDGDKPRDVKSGASILKSAMIKREGSSSDLAKKDNFIDHIKREPSESIKRESSFDHSKIKTEHEKKYPEKSKLSSINIFEAMEIKKPKLEKERSRSSTPELKLEKKKDAFKDFEKVRDKNRYKDKSEERSSDHDKDREKEKYREKEKIKKLEEIKKEKEVENIISSDNESEPEIATEISDESMDTDDFAATMGLTCTVCKQFDVTAGNQLVECQECHNLYHQECHRPQVATQDINDPRFVWYCVRCTKNMKKMQVTNKPSKPSTHSTPPAKLLKEPAVPFTKLVKQEGNSQPFKRVETVKPSSSLQSKPMGGLAGLAANLSGKSLQEAASKHLPSYLKPDPIVKQSTVTSVSKTSSKTSSTISSSTKTSSNNISADKKIQLMKKKSANKLLEKRL